MLLYASLYASLYVYTQEAEETLKMVSKLAVGYHQQRVELGLSVVTGKEQQIDVARQELQTKWSQLFFRCKNLSLAGMTSALLSASSTDR